ncbi:MAG: hypothetical protein ACL7BU_05760 [Candidatus Phlomobacter fragariae]
MPQGLQFRPLVHYCFRKAACDGYRDQAERKQILRSSAALENWSLSVKPCIQACSFLPKQKKGRKGINETLHLTIALAAHKISRIGNI